MAQFAPSTSPDEPVNPVALIEALGASVADRYAAIELRMIETVAKALRRGTAVDLTQSERFAIVDRLRRYGRQLADVAMSPDVAEQIIRTATEEGARAVISRLDLAGISSDSTAFTRAAQTAIAALAVDLENRLDVMTARITRWMPDVYRQAVAAEAAPVLGGVTDIRLAQRRVTERLLEQGIDGFQDAAGRKWRPGTYAEMATRTAVHRAYEEGSIASAASADLHLVTIIARPNSCRECAQQHNRIFSTDGRSAGVYPIESEIDDGVYVDVNVQGGLDVARSAGWDHPNCTCTVTAYLPGLNAPGYRMVWDEQRMKDRDRLRALERRMRELRRAQAAAQSPARRRQVAAQIKQQNARIAAHVDSTNEVRRRARESLSFTDGSARLPAIPAGL